MKRFNKVRVENIPVPVPVLSFFHFSVQSFATETVLLLSNFLIVYK